MENIVCGSAPYHAPKFKIYQVDNPGVYQANNLSSGGSLAGWTPYALKYRIEPDKPTREMTLEVAVQCCKGTLRVCNLSLAFEPPAPSQAFPYTVPTKIEASISIASAERRPFDPNLLGVNSHFASDGHLSYSHPEVQALIARWRVPLIRFPGGTVANWYDFTTDRFKFPPADEPFPPRGWNASPTRDFGFPAYATLCKQHGITSIQVFNIIQDSPEQSAERLRRLKASGIRVPWIELGNENSDAHQRGSAMPDLAAYIAKTKAICRALKAVDPQVLLAVNIDHPKDEWAKALAKESYFDAVVMHPYVFLGEKDFAGAIDPMMLRTLLAAYRIEVGQLGAYREIFGRKPLLLSEWGVVVPGSLQFNMATTLATADMFYAILDAAEEGPVQMASLHIFVGGFMGLAYAGKGGHLQKRSYGVFYEMLLEACLDADLYLARSASPELAPGLPALQARALLGKDGKRRLWAVNKCPVAGTLQVSVDGQPYAGAWRASQYSQTNLHLRMEYPLDTDPRTTTVGSGVISLAPYSLSVVTLD
ncbi:MAG: hypothetical protein J0L75_06820 [Spirochaetes bacterium]|nr:hypothetical protein [Spirochaetota bacterium]